jgi:hypothetical protein
MQTGSGALFLSIATLAAFLLGGGGMWLIVKRGDRKKGLLMLVAALVLLANVLVWAAPVPARQEPGSRPAERSRL